MFSRNSYSAKAMLEMMEHKRIQKLSKYECHALVGALIEMRVTLIMIIFSLSISFTNAQQTRFNKIYDLGGPSAIYNNIFNVIPVADSQYFFTGTNYDLTYPYNTNFFYGLMDDTGNILELRKNYLDTVTDYFNEYSCVFGHKYYTTFCAFNHLEDKYDVYLYCIAENLDTVWTKKNGYSYEFNQPKADIDK